MKKIVKLLILAAVVAAAAFGAYKAFFEDDSEKMVFKTSPVERRDIILTVDANGVVEPEDLVDVGARVSGEIVAFGKGKSGNIIDYGSEISEGDMIALIDDEIPQSDLLQEKARLAQAKASQSQAKANLLLAKASLRQAERDWARAQRLGVSEALSQASYDTYESAWEKATAEVSVAEAQILQADAEVAQAEASLKVAERNLEYCFIKAPVNGIIIDRKVNIGQTVVSNMSASSLFLVAKDLKRMEVWATVNEADIGSIRPGQPVTFTVEAFPGETFVGHVGKIRLNATMSQNVVTYVVEVVTDNSSGRLLPYLTANVSFEVDRKDNALAIPNSAMRWVPEVEQVAEGVDVEELGDSHRVWIIDGEKVRPVKVSVVLDDGAFSAVESEGLKEGMKIVTGMESMAAAKQSEASTNPFMPKMPQRRRR